MGNPLRALLPQAFSERMQIQLAKEYDAFCASLDTAPPVSIHSHPIKGNRISFESILTTSVPWCKNGFYLEQRPRFTLDPAFHAGAYYVQEPSSMIIDYIFRIILRNTDVKILDLCAAPGGKSTLISSILNGNGLLVSNEIIGNRIPGLKHNLLKWGYANQVITSSDPERFKSLPGFFDVVLVDAPCSGEGLFRKDPLSRKEWSDKNVSQCVQRQSRIVESVSGTVKQGGYLIYSTCTYNPDENSNQLKYLVKSGWTPIRLEKLKDWGFDELEDSGSIGYQAYPHKVKGEGFFISVFQKSDDHKHESTTQGNTIDWIKRIPHVDQYLLPIKEFDFFRHNEIIHFLSVKHSRDLEVLSHYLRISSAGTVAGEFKGNDFIPDHALSQSIYLNPAISGVELTKAEAINYLKRISPVNAFEQRGYTIAKYNNHNLGWLKGIQGRFNNLYPNEYRIKGNFDQSIVN